MNSLTRCVPRLITGTAILHISVGLVVGTPFSGIADAGIIDSVGDDAERESALWFHLTGLAWLSPWASLPAEPCARRGASPPASAVGSSVRG